MSFPLFSQNGEILPMEQATVPLSNIEYCYGFGVYENIRVVKGRPLFLPDHIERLFASCEAIGLRHPLSADHISTWISDLIGKVESEAFNLKLLLIGSPDGKNTVLSIIPLAPKFPDKKLYTKGATAITTHYERQFPQAKTLNMLGSYLAYRSAKDAGAYDALLIDRDGCITEGTRTNFLALCGQTIVCPPLKDILLGVTLKHIIAVAAEAGFTIVHEPIPVSGLSSIDGACITSTSAKIMPLNRIDDLTVPIPDTLKRLMQLFDAFLKKEEDRKIPQ
ncbi:MAG: aminotransferase class IV [Candidatus Peribacteraceae bacterium]|nr:aminotransferase class IV [Candidatus Peribacteraceae bacterium]